MVDLTVKVCIFIDFCTTDEKALSYKTIGSHKTYFLFIFVKQFPELFCFVIYFS